VLAWTIRRLRSNIFLYTFFVFMGHTLTRVAVGVAPQWCTHG